MPRMNASCLRHLGLADAGRTGEQERADRLVGLAQPGARHLDGGRQRVDGRVPGRTRRCFRSRSRSAACCGRPGDRLRRDAGDLGDDVLDLALADDLLLLRLGQDALRGAGFVDDVDRLVGQVTVVDVLADSSAAADSADDVYLMPWCSSKRDLQAAQDLHGLLDRRLVDVDLLEAARQRVVLLEDAAVLVERGRADALQLADRQRRLQQVGCVERAARRRTGADEVWISSMNRMAFGVGAQLLQDGLEALFEVAAVLGAGQQARPCRANRRLASAGFRALRPA